jgi:hypothetical protein
MAQNKNTPGIDLPNWQTLNSPPTTTTTGSIVIGGIDPTDDINALYAARSSELYTYNKFNDAWTRIPNGFNTVTVAAGLAGACGWEIRTNLAFSNNQFDAKFFSLLSPTELLLRDSALISKNDIGRKLQCLFNPPNTGSIRTILNVEPYTAYNANLNIKKVTIDSPFQGTLVNDGVCSFRVLKNIFMTYQFNNILIGRPGPEIALSLGTTNGPPSWGTAGNLVTTPSYLSGSYDTGNASSSTSTTLTDSSKSWYSGQWVNFQIRIKSGPAEGAVRTITASTSDTITIDTNWSLNPSSSDTYSIEANDNIVYLFGNNNGILYKKELTNTTTWSNLNLGGITGTEIHAFWVPRINSLPIPTLSNYQDGAYVFVKYGTASSTYAAVDIRTMTLTTFSNIEFVFDPYTNAGLGFSAANDSESVYVTSNNLGFFGGNSILDNRRIYLKRDIYPQGTGVVGNKMYVDSITDSNGNTKKYLYNMMNSLNVFRRLELQ